MSNINEVRQVLMNELGLTRDSVRAMATTIVEQMVDRHVQQLISSGHVEKLVSRSVEQALRVGRYGQDSMKKLIADAAGKAFAEQVRADLYKNTVGDLG